MTASDPVDAFLSWLIAMDDPNNPDGMETRQTITLTRIIQHARDLQLWRQLDRSTPADECAERGIGDRDCAEHEQPAEGCFRCGHDPIDDHHAGGCMRCGCSSPFGGLT